MFEFPIIEVKGAEIETAAVEASPDVRFEFESQSFSWMQVTGAGTTPPAEEA